ncbi:MAG: hypothetical protein KGL39_50075 [Patescibacteria group bacterium]|nr:hypothetical protein [Patescibacteria group bacterium]
MDDVLIFLPPMDTGKHRLKTGSAILTERAKGVSFCGSGKNNSITIDGRTFTPDPDAAYIEFVVGHAFPVVTKYRTGIHPQVVANSYRSMLNKVFNLAHIMRKYDPKNNPRDRILGSIVAVELHAGGATVEMPEGGWTVGNRREEALGIRVVAVIHKAAQDAESLIEKWFDDNAEGDAGWMVSMENEFDLKSSGFIVNNGRMSENSLADFWEDTPEDLKALGFVYVPCLNAPLKLLECLNTDEDDERDGETSTRVCRDYLGQKTLLLLNGLNGTMRFRGVGLCPAGIATGMEAEAQVKTMLAAERGFNLDRVTQAFDDFGTLLRCEPHLPKPPQ